MSDPCRRLFNVHGYIYLYVNILDEKNIRIHPYTRPPFRIQSHLYYRYFSKNTDTISNIPSWHSVKEALPRWRSAIHNHSFILLYSLNIEWWYVEGLRLLEKGNYRLQNMTKMYRPVSLFSIYTSHKAKFRINYSKPRKSDIVLMNKT